MKSYKTTIIGLILAIIVAVQPMIATGEINWKAVGMAALIAAFGFVSKDANVTGGTVANSDEAQKRIDASPAK